MEIGFVSLFLCLPLHLTTHRHSHTPQDVSPHVICTSQRSLPNNTQHSPPPPLQLSTVAYKQTTVSLCNIQLTLGLVTGSQVHLRIILTWHISTLNYNASCFANQILWSWMQNKILWWHLMCLKILVVHHFFSLAFSCSLLSLGLQFTYQFTPYLTTVYIPVHTLPHYSLHTSSHLTSLQFAHQFTPYLTTVCTPVHTLPLPNILLVHTNLPNTEHTFVTITSPCKLL
jgi:hypothetical protein